MESRRFLLTPLFCSSRINCRITGIETSRHPTCSSISILAERIATRSGSPAENAKKVDSGPWRPSDGGPSELVRYLSWVVQADCIRHQSGWARFIRLDIVAWYGPGNSSNCGQHPASEASPCRGSDRYCVQGVNYVWRLGGPRTAKWLMSSADASRHGARPRRRWPPGRAFPPALRSPDGPLPSGRRRRCRVAADSWRLKHNSSRA